MALHAASSVVAGRSTQSLDVIASVRGSFFEAIRSMKVSPKFGLVTRLVFCSEDVDPEVVTKTLGFTPTFSQRVGEAAADWEGREYTAHLGTWKLKLPGEVENLPLEQQLEQWLTVLEPKSAALGHLNGLGYRGYIDCPGHEADLSAYLEPPLMKRLGELTVGVSIWLYESPKHL
jgi:hypothetical protein